MTSYYELGAANDRIAELRPLLTALREDRDAIAAAQARLRRLASADEPDRAELEREREAVTVIVRRMEQAVRQIDGWGLTLRDIGTGLVDFPALASGRPIWLCWKLGEEDIAYWHELDAGIAGRKPLIELESHGRILGARTDGPWRACSAAPASIYAWRVVTRPPVQRHPAPACPADDPKHIQVEPPCPSFVT